MSDFTPNPEANGNGEAAFSFDNMQVSDTDFPGFNSPEPEPPNNKATKRKWWEPKNKNTKAPKASEPKRRGRPPSSMSDAALKAALEQFYAGISMFAMPFCQHCAINIGNSAEDAAQAMVDWAKTNPAVKRFLVNMVSISAGGKVMAIHGAMILPVAMHHVPALQRKQEAMIPDLAEAMTRQAAENWNKGNEES